MNSIEVNKTKNRERLIDDLYNFCKIGKSKKIDNLVSNNNKVFSNYIIDEAIRIIIRNYNSENKEYLKSLGILLKFIKNINLRNDSQDNATILIEAACSEKLEILELILSFFPIKKKNNQRTIENIKDNRQIIKENIEFNQESSSSNFLDLDIKDNNGETVLHKIIKNDTMDKEIKIECVKKLIEKSADVNEVNILGETPIALALSTGSFDLVKLLINSGANIHHVISSNEENMLHYAIKGKNPSVFYLIESVDPKHKNKSGLTPIDLAKNKNFEDFINHFNNRDNLIDNNFSKNVSFISLINEISNENFSQVMSQLNDISSTSKLNNDLRINWDILLAEYYKFFINDVSFDKNNKFYNKKNRKDSNEIKNNNLKIENQKTNLKNNQNKIKNYQLIDFDEILNNTIIHNNDNRQYFLQKFFEFFNKIKEDEVNGFRTNKIIEFNAGLFWFQMGNYRNTINYFLKCLNHEDAKKDFLFYSNATIILVNILQNLKEFPLCNELVENLENYIFNSIKNYKNSNGNTPMIIDYNNNLENPLLSKYLLTLYTKKEILNPLNSYDELNYFLNIFKAQSYLFEDKIDECKKSLKEYKRLFNILELKDSIPLLNSFKKIYHVIKIRIHYLNNNINKSLKHFKFISDMTLKNNDLDSITLEIGRLNNFGIINLKQKKFFLAQFNFKNGLMLLKKLSPYCNFNVNIINLRETLLFNLAISYFFEKKFDLCYTSLKKISGKPKNNPFYFYRLGLSCLEMEVNNINKNNSNNYNDLLEKYSVKKQDFLINNQNNNPNNLLAYNSENNIRLEALSDSDNLNNRNKRDISEGENFFYPYDSYYILKNSENFLLNSKLILEAIEYFKIAIISIKSKQNLEYQKELFEISECFKLNNKKLDKNKQNVSDFRKNISKSLTNILISSYLNLIFCSSLKNFWNEMIYFINQLESSNLPINDLGYIIDNYKMEAYLGLNQSFKVIELLKKNMLNGNYTYNCLDLKGNFFSKIIGNICPEINFKIALYTNVIKLNFLNNNILEVEKGIFKIIGLYNMNINLNQNLDTILLPSYLINILIYYYLIKENFETAIYLIKKRKLPTNTLLINEINKTTK